MSTKASVNGRTVIHMGTSGMSIASADVCLTPMGPAVVPIPYPNIAQSATLSGGTSRVEVDGLPIAHAKSKFAMSSGDEGGVMGNLITGGTKGPATFLSYSMDVTVDGKPACRQGDMMVNNCAGTTPGTPPAREMQAPAPSAAALAALAHEAAGKKPKPKTVQFQLLDETGKPVPGEPYEVRHSDGKVAKGKLDKQGLGKVSGVTSPTYQLRFPERELQDWEMED